MPLSLYDATIPAFQQQLTAVAALLDKASAHCVESNTPENALIHARLIEDMLPFNYQVKSTVVHSLGAVQALAKGVFSPDLTPSPETIQGLKERVTQAMRSLEALAPGDVNAFEGRDMRFEFRDFKLPFTAENFLLSFSLPNFYFHAATAYDILRHNGVAIGKRDFTGPLRLKT